MSYHADYLFIGTLLGTHHFFRHTLYQEKRMFEPSVNKRRMGAFINIRIIETDHRRLVFGNRRKFGSQRGVHLV